MRKLKVLSLLTILFVSFFVCIQNAYAATITELKYENNKISLSGTGNTQVQIVLFGPDNSPLYMTTAPVENGKFGMVLPEIANMESGDYTVKVADYDGKNVDSKILAIAIEQGTENVSKTNDGVETDDVSEGSSENSVKTGDENSVYTCYICGVLAIVSGAVLLILNIRKQCKTDPETITF